MATSGVTSFDMSRDSIIASVLRKLGVLAKGQSPDTEDINNTAQALNLVTQLFVTKGMPLWKRSTLPVTLVLNTHTYTIPDAVRVVQVLVTSLNSTVQYELTEKALYDLYQLPTSNGGVPVHYAVLPGIQNSQVRIWPTPDASAVANYSISVVHQRDFDSFVNANDTPDFPPWWIPALIDRTAMRMAPEYGVPLSDRQVLTAEAKMSLEEAMDYMPDTASLYVQPNRMR